jgi:hypothetical protein
VSTTFLLSEPAGLMLLLIGIVAAILIGGVVAVLFSFKVSKEKRNKLIATGIILFVTGGFVFYLSDPYQANSITVGGSSVQISAPPYFNLDVTASQIKQAYVVNLSDWNVSISARTSGTALGSFNSGYFTLSNGASADLLSDGNTNLVLVLNSGTYVILGPTDFQTFLSDFNQSVTQASSAG